MVKHNYLLIKIMLLAALHLLAISENNASEVTLNASWEFIYHKSDSPEDVDRITDWKVVNLPHTWNREDPVDGVRGYKQGTGWYRKNLYIAQEDKDQVFLKFEGANQLTKVYINNQAAGEHAGGYTAFMVDVTPFIKPGEENTILVKVDNSLHPDIPPLMADFTFFGGIYRDVWLVRRHNVHFDLLDKSTKGVYVRTPEVSHTKASLQVKANLRNVSGQNRRVRMEVFLYDQNFSLVAQKNTNVRLAASPSEGSAQLTLEVLNPELWSPDSPVLYTAEVNLKDSRSGELLDQIVIKRGFRWFEMDENNGFLLNGEPLKLTGVNRHQDYKGFGNALPDILHYNDVKLIKEMGGNFIRIAHYPQDPAVLQACDELGILAYEEIPIVNRITVNDDFRKNSEKMLLEMIRQHYNHTSVVMWGFMNEVLLQLNQGLNNHPHLERAEYLEAVHELTSHLNGVSKAEDPDRFTVIAHHGNYDVYQEARLNDITDIVGWNLYFGWYSAQMDRAGTFLDTFNKNHPDRGILIAEYGGGSDPRIRAIDPVRFDFSIEWKTAIHAAYHQQIMERPHVMGGAIWVFADFSSEGRKDVVPQINSKGVVNYDRSLKDSYLYYQAALAKEPYLRIGSLDWNRRAGFANNNNRLEQPVFIFSNQDNIDVWREEEHLGIFDVTNYHARVMVPFKAGKNTIRVKIDNGIEQQSDFFATVHPSNLMEIQPQQVDLKMNMGAHFYFTDDISHEIWIPEQEYTPGSLGYMDGSRLMTWRGSRVGTDVAIGGTDNEPIYQTLRDTISGFRADVPDGWYEVTLHFAEIYSKQVRETLAYNLGADEEELPGHVDRAFRIKANGYDILTVQDMVDFQATPYRFRVRASEKQGIILEFEAIRGSAFLSAISIKGL